MVMSLASLSRGLTATTAASSAARTCRSSLSRSVASWNCPPGKLQTPRASFIHNAFPRSSFHARPFSSTPSIHSSLFRQTSDKTQSTRPPSPSEESLEHPHDSQPAEDVEPGVYYSPYQPKRSWPPDMSKLSKKHQFRLERKYRRRAALKYARPKWTKATKLVQWGIIGFVLIYAVLFMDWDPKDNPVEEVRKEFFSGVDSIFSSPQPPSPAHRGEDKSKR